MLRTRAPRSAYPIDRSRQRYLGHTHWPCCGAARPIRREDVLMGQRPRHTCAFGDMVECPQGCGLPIVRRLPDGLALDMDLTPHRCPGRDAEASFRYALAEGEALGYWPWYPAQRRRREQAEERERDLEAALYAEWLAFRTAMGLPDRGEGELP